MTNAIDEYWDADGTSLHTYAHSIESTGEHIRGTAALRGSDLLVPFRPGEVWTPKVPGPRTITLKMWVRGTDADGVWDADPHGKFNDNFIALRRLLWRTDRQIALTKRWRSAADGLIHVATAHAEYSSGLDNMAILDNYRDSTAGKFTVDLRLSYPYFDGAAIAAPVSGVVNNIGEDTARKITIVFSGAGSITNTTTGRTLSVGGACTVDVWNFNAPGQLASVSLTGQKNEAFWFTLRPGANAITSSHVSSLTYVPVYQ